MTPAHGRLDVSRICFEQRADAIVRLHELGIDAAAVVIADDENLDIALELGMGTVDFPNESPDGQVWLGAKFNEGYQFAGAEGADYIFPIGSDTWVDPEFIAAGIAEAKPDAVIYSRHYGMLRSDGRARGQLLVEYLGGCGMAIPSELLRPCGWRPCVDKIGRGCDSSVLRTLSESQRHPVRGHVSEIHALELVTMRSDSQISDYKVLLDKWGVGETDSPYDGLDEFYPDSVIEATRQFYAGRLVAA